ncbi:hypothetical protein D3C87_1679800 [compost metagenome]
MIGLRFLTAKTTAHAPRIDCHSVHWQVEHRGHQLLDLGRVLSRGIHQHAAVLGRHHRCNLGFQIKVFLTADMQLPLNAVFRLRQRAVGVTPLMTMRLLHQETFP